MRRSLSATIVLALMLVAGAALAQVNTMGTPTYGTYNVNAGFSPDPTSYSVLAGGNVNASTVSSSCWGNIAAVPDVRVNYTAGTFPLRFYVDSVHDTTLAINGPDGQWYCNDDTVGLNPVIDFPSPMSGQYDIFVGTYSSGQNPSVALYMTELPTSYGPGSGAAVPTTPTPTAQVNIMGTPTYGTFNVNAGFSPDPTNYPVLAGGNVDASTVSPSCWGNIAAVPDVRVNYTAGTFPLRFYVDSAYDTTLAVNGPDGQWYCNDDTVGLNPVIDFPSPTSGQYDIFIGTYSSGQNPSVNLSMTELPGTYGPGSGSMVTPPTPTPTPTPMPATGINAMGNPSYGTYNVNSGFSPDPTVYTVVAGGTNNAQTISPSCVGQIASVPDVRVNYTAGTFPLRFYVDAPQDTTLVINAPNGQWYCNDDTVGFDPVIDFPSPMSGQYDIFVGTYSPGSNPTVNLSMTELPGSYGPTP